jgi:hypothetical protein
LLVVRRVVIVAGAALAASCFASPAAVADCGGVKRAHPSRHAVPGRPPLVIGDSVLLGAVDEVARVGYEVNTRGCRQMTEGLRVLARRRRAGKLPALVVFMLGTNWKIEPAEIRAALRIIGPGRTLGLVTPRKDPHDASVMRAAGRRHPARVVVLDWARYTGGHSRWLSPDGLHLGPGGARALARLLRTGLRYAAPLDGRWQRLSSGGSDSFSGASSSAG